MLRTSRIIYIYIFGSLKRDLELLFPVQPLIADCSCAVRMATIAASSPCAHVFVDSGACYRIWEVVAVSVPGSYDEEGCDMRIAAHLFNAGSSAWVD